jgi:hypothetical protein
MPILVAMVLVVYGVDRGITYFFTEQTLAPVLCVICLASLVFTNSPSLVAFAIPLFAIECYWMIKDRSMYPYIRTASVILGGLLAFWASLQKKSLELHLAELDLILIKLQAPWILCDRFGNIRRMSALASKISQVNLKDFEGSSFFINFSAVSSKGELIQKFLQASDSRDPVEKISLALATTPARTVEASFIPIQTRDGSDILVILNPSQT